MKLSVAFNEIAELHARLGLPALDKMARPWVFTAGPWRVTVNGTGAPVDVGGVTLERFHAFLEFNGWPAGVIHPFGGVIAAGALANEDTFIAALRAEGMKEVERT